MNKLSLQLKQGEFTALNGTYTKGNRDLNIRFNYNRTFKGDYTEKNRDISKYTESTGFFDFRAFYCVLCVF